MKEDMPQLVHQGEALPGLGRLTLHHDDRQYRVVEREPENGTLSGDLPPAGIAVSPEHQDAVRLDRPAVAVEIVPVTETQPAASHDGGLRGVIRHFRRFETRSISFVDVFQQAPIDRALALHTLNELPHAPRQVGLLSGECAVLRCVHLLCIDGCRVHEEKHRAAEVVRESAQLSERDPAATFD